MIYFSKYVAHVCIVYIDVSKVHWQTIYCEKFTVDETGHFAWAMFGEDNISIMSSIMFEKNTESS